MMDPASAGQPSPRAFLRIAGATLAQHQLGLALALDCQRVICIARETSPDVIALQHAAEATGLQFYLSTGPRQLASLVTASDELVVICEGLFVDSASAAALFAGRGAAVLVQPIEGAQVAGFERIDINRAAAGIGRIPGVLAERLHELPADCDAVSALTRIALQAGVELREVPVTARAGAGWRMVRTEAEALAVENEWLREQFSPAAGRSPGRVLARHGVIAFGSSLLHAGNASNALSLAVLAILALAGVLGWFSLAWAGFLCAGAGWVLAAATRQIRRAERRALGEMPPAVPRADALCWLVDAVFAGLAISVSERHVGEPVLSWLFAPLMLMLLLVLVPRLVDARLNGWIGDRALLALVLAVAAGLGQVGVVIEVLCLALVGAALLLPERSQS